jgi:hypothetical protein
MTMRDRVKELRRVPASELRANPKNWRTHPPAQQEGLRIMLERIGYADAVIARDTDEGLVLIDGHLRVSTTPDAMIPVLVVDLSDAEADEVLATLDPLAALAEPDVGLLKELLEGISADDTMQVLLEDISDAYNVGLTELLEQATAAHYVPPDGSFAKGEGDAREGLRGIWLHFELNKYDEIMEKGFMLGEEWGLDTLADVFYEAVRRVSHGAD